MTIFVMAVIASGLLALGAAADLVFARRDWSTAKRLSAWLALILLLGSIGLMVGMPGSAPAQMVWVVVAAAVASFACAIPTGGRFRWFVLSAVVLWLVAIFPIVAFLGSSQGVR